MSEEILEQLLIGSTEIAIAATATLPPVGHVYYLLFEYEII